MHMNMAVVQNILTLHSCLCHHKLAAINNLDAYIAAAVASAVVCEGKAVNGRQDLDLWDT